MELESNFKWNVFILHQFYEEDTDIFDLFYKDIQESAHRQKINFYILKHDIRKAEATVIFSDASTRHELLSAKLPLDISEFYFNMEVPLRLWNIFFSFCKTKESGRNFIVVQGHGAGFGFCPKEHTATGSENSAKGKFVFSNNIFKLSRRLPVLKEAPQEANVPGEDEIEMIPVSIFQQSLVMSFNDKIIDFLCFSNCFMQCIETGFVFKNCIKYLVASQGIHISTGLNFPKLYEDLTNGNSLEIIAFNITKYLDERFNDSVIREIHNNHNESTFLTRGIFTLSVNKAESYDTLKSMLSDFGMNLLISMRKFNNLLTLINEIRADEVKCRDVQSGNPIGVIDLCNFLYEFVNIEAVPEGLKIKAFALINFIRHEVILFSHLPGRTYVRGGEFGICPFGVSIFFPLNKHDGTQNEFTEQLFMDFYQKKSNLSTFLIGNRWRNFVRFFYNHDTIT